MCVEIRTVQTKESYMDIFEKARLEAMKPGVSKEPTVSSARTKREPSKNEQMAEYQPPAYGILFCPHKKSYFETCPSCKRTRSDAKRNENLFIEKHL